MREYMNYPMEKNKMFATLRQKRNLRIRCDTSNKAAQLICNPAAYNVEIISSESTLITAEVSSFRIKIFPPRVHKNL